MERLKEAVGVRSERALSQHFGYGPTAMTGKRQRGSIPYEEAARVALETGISLDWLILGKVDSAMVRDVEATYDVAAASSEPGNVVWLPIYRVDHDAAAILEPNRHPAPAHIPYYLPWLEQDGMTPGTAFAVTVSDDAMAPTLQVGDVAMVDRADADMDGVCLVAIDGALRIRRLQRLTGGRVRLAADNGHYASEEMTPDQLDGFQVIGHCRRTCGRLR